MKHNLLFPYIWCIVYWVVCAKPAPSRWGPDALFQCRCSGIGIMHRDATGPDALLPRFAQTAYYKRCKYFIQPVSIQCLSYGRAFRWELLLEAAKCCIFWMFCRGSHSAVANLDLAFKIPIRGACFMMQPDIHRHGRVMQIGALSLK